MLSSYRHLIGAVYSNADNSFDVFGAYSNKPEKREIPHLGGGVKKQGACNIYHLTMSNVHLSIDNDWGERAGSSDSRRLTDDGRPMTTGR
jgi:hypothetical protein